VKAGKAGQSVEELQSARDQLAKAIAQLQGVPIRVEWFGLAQTALKSYQSQLDDLDRRIEALKKQREEYDQAIRLAEAAVKAGKAGKSVKELQSARDQLAKAIAQLQRVPHLAQAALRAYQSQLDDLDRRIEILKKQSQQHDQATATGQLVIAPDKPAESVPELYKAEKHKGIVFNLLISLVSGMVGAAAVVYVYSVLDAPITEPERDEQIAQGKPITEPDPDQQIAQERYDQAIATGAAVITARPAESAPDPDQQIAQERYDQAIATGVAVITARPAESAQELQQTWKLLGSAIAELKEIPKDSGYFGPAQKALKTYQAKLDDLEEQIEGQIGKDWKRFLFSTPVILRSGGVFDVEYSPDGTTIASASIDGTVRLWRPTHTSP